MCQVRLLSGCVIFIQRVRLVTCIVYFYIRRFETFLMFLLYLLNILSFFLEIHQWVTVTLFLEPPYIHVCRLFLYSIMSGIYEVNGYRHL
jgi:hypothetical protein